MKFYVITQQTLSERPTMDISVADDELDAMLKEFNFKLPDDSILSKTQQIRVGVLKTLLMNGASFTDPKILAIIKGLMADVDRTELTKIRLVQDQDSSDAQAGLVAELMKELMRKGEQNMQISESNEAAPLEGDTSDLVIHDYELKDGMDTGADDINRLLEV